jgi:L-alanine-DL-glutamate epimerase-like enolase superfamily enzyme
MGALDIVGVEAVGLRFACPPAAPFRSSRGVEIDGMLTTLVRVTARNGLVGTGPVYSHPRLVQVAVDEVLAPLLIGRDAGAIDEAWRRLASATRWYGRSGAVMSALGGVDTALWDLVGQHRDRRVCELLGGRDREVEAYASAVQFDPLDAIPARVAAFREQGHRHVKVRAGVNLEYDVEATRRVLALVAPGAMVMVDAVKRLDSEAARALARGLAALDVRWLEEPLPPEDVQGYATLRAQTSVPIAAGESETDAQAFARLLAAGALDVAQPDVSRVGGITAGRRVARLAEAHNAVIATHTWSDPAAVLANAHLVAAIPNGLCVEVNALGTPFFTELLAAPLEIRDGRLRLPDAPGLGIVLDEEAVERHRLGPGPVPPGAYADMWLGDVPDERPYPADSLESYFASADR